MPWLCWLPTQLYVSTLWRNIVKWTCKREAYVRECESQWSSIAICSYYIYAVLPETNIQIMWSIRLLDGLRVLRAVQFGAKLYNTPTHTHTPIRAIFRRQSVDGARKLSFNLPSFFWRSYMPRFTCSTDQIVGSRSTHCVSMSMHMPHCSVCECLVFFFCSIIIFFCHGRLAIARAAFPHTHNFDRCDVRTKTVWFWMKWWRWNDAVCRQFFFLLFHFIRVYF